MSNSASRSTGFQRPGTAQDAVVDELRRQILTGELRPGDHVIQDELAATLGVSRIPIREALSVLTAEGTIRHRPHQGYRVASLDAKELDEIHQVLRLLEDEAIRHVANRSDEATLARLTQELEEMEACASDGSSLRFVDLYRDFRFEIFEMADMPRLTRFIRLAWQSCDAYRLAWLSHEDARQVTCKAYRDILQRIEAQDIDGAIEALDAHRAAAFDGESASLAC